MLVHFRAEEKEGVLTRPGTFAIKDFTALINSVS